MGSATGSGRAVDTGGEIDTQASMDVTRLPGVLATHQPLGEGLHPGYRLLGHRAITRERFLQLRVNGAFLTALPTVLKVMLHFAGRVGIELTIEVRLHQAGRPPASRPGQRGASQGAP